MSNKVAVFSVQPDVDGPIFARAIDPTDTAALQDYAHGHIEQIVKDLLVAGAPGAQVAGFAATVAGTLHVSIAHGVAVAANGLSYDSPTDAVVVNLAAAHATLPRIDLIYATLEADAETDSSLVSTRRLRTTEELEAVPPVTYESTEIDLPTRLRTRASIAVHTGTPNASPAAPAAGAGEVPLWQVHVGAAQTVLGGGDITSVRVLLKSLYAVLQDVIALQATTANLSELIDDRVSVLLVDSTWFTKNYDDAGNLLTLDLDLAATDARYVNATGDTMTGNLNFSRGVAGENILLSFETAGSGGSFGGAWFELTHGAASWAYIRMSGRSIAPTGTQIEFGVNNNDTGYTPPSTKLLIRPDGLFVTGQLAVTANLSKGSGTFLIDHPLDPDNKDLAHGFVESPRFDLIYRGRVQLVGGSVTVDIDEASGMTPGTFAALCKNPQFSQPYNETGWDKVRVAPDSLEGGTFALQCENAGSTDWVSWSVIAERNDAFVTAISETDEDGSLVVERDKPAPDLDLLEAVTRQIEGAESETVQEVVTELIGSQGYRRHAAFTGSGAIPMRDVIINPEE
jgi:hypothetical protein